MAASAETADADRLIIRIDFYRPVYHGLDRGGAPEWPPSPLRLVGALIAGAHALRDDTERDRALAAIRALTTTEPPVIVSPSLRPWFVPPTFTQRTGHPSASMSYFLDLGVLGLSSTTRVAKPQGAQLLDDTRLLYLVPGAARLADALRPAARLIPYFGRSMDLCDVSVDEVSVPPAVEGVGRTEAAPYEDLYPIDDDNGPSRGWTPDTVDWYNANYDIVRRYEDRPPIPSVAFERRLRYSRFPEPPGPGEVFVLPVALGSPAKLAGDLHVRFSQRGPGEAASLHDSGWQYFVCVRAGTSHADGRAVGVGLVPPPGAPAEERHRATSATRDAIPSASADEVAGRMWASPDYWCRPRTSWTSATPLWGFPDIRVLAHALVAEARERFGQEPHMVRAEQRPLHKWQHRWPSTPHDDGGAQWWVQLQFDEPVAGPLILGSATDRGHGLFAPLAGGEPA